MVHVRAPAVLSRLRWIVEHHGEAAYDEALAMLDTANAAEIRAAVLPTQWVPFDAFIALTLALDKRYGKGDLQLCRALGRYSANVNLPTLYRIFYKLGTVPYIMSKATAVWSAHYDSGAASVVDHGNGDISVKVENFATPHKAHCLAVLGWIEESVKISGSELAAGAEVKCRLNGDDYCEFRGKYR
jgi:hypothetical protein